MEGGHNTWDSRSSFLLPESVKEIVWDEVMTPLCHGLPVHHSFIHPANVGEALLCGRHRANNGNEMWER